MAMFLSRIKKALNLGTKSITQNGTYNASSDGYDGYSSVEVNVAGVTPTPITPSNSSPAALTSGTAVSPTANGYAIASYSSITPSNSSPAAITNGDIYKAMANGKAISSLSEVAPSNANPPNVHTGDICKITTRDGYLISTINIVEPSDSNPPLLSNNNSWYRLNGASGYLYSTIQPKVATGTFTRTTSSNNTINCGFAPDMIFLIKGSGTTTTISAGDFRAAYWNGWSTSYVVDDYRSSSGYYLKNEPMSDFFTITSTGFVYAKALSSTYAGTVKYIAVKYT